MLGRVVLGAMLIIAACGGEPAPDTTAGTSTTAPEQGRAYGVALSARDDTAEGVEEFFDLASDAGEIVFHNADWRDLDPETGPFALVVRFGADHGLAPMIGISANGFGTMLRPLDDATIDDYLDRLRRFLTEVQPPFLGVGNEVNALATESPADLDAVVDLFERAAAVVEELSPETLVYPVFQFEWLLGRRGGVFGGREDLDDAQWDLIDRFLSAEAIGITTYPGLVFPTPADIPASYYSQIPEHTHLPIIITETGWQSGTGPPGYEGTEQLQAAFVERLDVLTADLDVRAIVWPLLFDTKVSQVPFDSMGLREDDGSPRPAWDAWTATDRPR